MKKIRLLSMLMAVALVFTSLPLMATAVAADEATAMTAGQSVSIPSSSAGGWGTGVSAVEEKYYTTSNLTAGADVVYVDLSSVELTSTDKYKYVYSIRYNGEGDFAHTARFGPSGNEKNRTATADWTELNAGPFAVNGSFASSKSFFLRTKTTQNGSVDVRGVKILKNDTPIYTWGVYADTPDWSTSPVRGGTLVDNSALKMTNDQTSGSFGYDAGTLNLILKPGVYQLSGEFWTDSADMTIGVKVNDTALKVGLTSGAEATVGTTRASKTFTLNVYEEAALSTLDIDVISKNASDVLSVSGLALKCVELTSASTDDIAKGAVIASSDSTAFWSSNAAIEIVEDKYYTASGVAANTDVVSVNLTGTQWDNSNDTYQYFYSIRYNGEGDFAHTARFGPTGNEKNRTATADWQELTAGPFKVNGNFATSPSFVVRAKAAMDGSVDVRGIKILKNGSPFYTWGIYADAPDWTASTSPVAGAFVDNSNLKLVPAASGVSTFTYDAAAKSISLAPGKYIISAELWTDADSQNVTISAVTANNDTAALVTGASTTANKKQLELVVTKQTTLSAVEISFEGTNALNIRDLKITAVQDANRSGIQAGMFMVLLLKKNSTPKFEYTNLIPHVLADAETSYWSTQGGTVTVKETEGKQYLAFGGIEKNYQTFAYTPSVTLEAGNTYQISGMMRASVKGQGTQNRVWLGSIKLGSIKLDNQWTSFSYNVTVDTATELVLKFNGDAAEVFNKPYDVINLKVINLNENPSYVAPEPDEEEDVKPSTPAKEYVDNGNEEVVLKAVDGSLAPDVFNDVGSDKWAISDQSLTVKSQGGNLYLAMRDITVNHVGFTYKSGVALEAGTYMISCEMRTAVKGQTTMVRAQANGTVVKMDWINNEWSTFSGEFTVAQGDELVIKFFGGPDGSFIKDYDVRNIVVVKMG